MLKATNIQLNYGKKKVLQGASLEVLPGTCIGILGTNGCGKSTLLKVLAGVLTPASGNIYYNGEDAYKNPSVFLSYAGYVPQDNPLMEELSVADNLKLWNLTTKHEIVHMLGLDSICRNKVRTLSGGMKKRLSLAIALANKPSVLILDEPTAALDLPCKEEIREYLRRYRKEGGSIVITTHEEPDFDICDSLYLLQNGCLHEIPANSRGSELTKQMTQSN